MNFTTEETSQISLTQQKKRIKIYHKKTKRQQTLFFLGVLALFAYSLYRIDLDFSYFSTGIQRTSILFQQFLTPDLSVLPKYLEGLLETFLIAFVSLLVSVMFSIFLACVVAENTAPSKLLSKTIKNVLVFIRAIPMTIWVLIAAASVGFGSLAGVLGLFFPTTSYLVKTIAALIEDSGNDIIEAMKSVGASWFEMIFKGVFVQLMPQILAALAFRFELCISESIVLGMVGVAGIGYRLNMAIATYKFDVAATGIYLVFITMLLMELTTKKLTGLLKKKG